MFFVFKEMILIFVILDLDLRFFFIVMFGVLDERGGEKLLFDILEVNEKIKGDYYFVLGVII